MLLGLLWLRPSRGVKYVVISASHTELLITDAGRPATFQVN